MATIGLKIADSPDSGASLGLADVLAKGIFGDPEGQMKARALAAQVGAHQAYAANLAEKTQEDQTAEAERLRAGPLVGDAAAAAVPMPVPVDALNPPVAGPEGWDAIGATHPVPVSQHDWDVHNSLVARERALGPILVRGTPTQVAEGVGKDYGGTILASAANNPAIVKPDALRIAGGLYTGTAPSTSTVWDTGDTAGVDASAREKIAVDAAKPDVSKTIKGDDGQIYSIGKDATGKPTLSLLSGGPGPVSKAPELKKDAAGNDIQWDPATQKWVPAPGGATAPPDKQEIQVVDGVPMAVTRDPTSNKIVNLKPIEGTPPQAPSPLYQGKTAKDDALNRIEMIKEKIRNKQTITPQEEALYETDFNLNYGPTTTKAIDPGTGKPTSSKLYPSIPPDTPSINDMRTLVGLPPAPEPAPDVFTSKAPTAEQTQLQQYAPQLIESTTKLDKLTPTDVPNAFIQQITGRQRRRTRASSSSCSRPPVSVSPQQREFGQAVAEYNQSLLYMLSGKAITPDEYKRAMRSYIPLPGDDANQLATKARQRHIIIASAVRLGFSSDPDMAKTYASNVKKTTGIDLAPLDLTGSLGDVQPPVDGKPPISSFFK